MNYGKPILILILSLILNSYFLIPFAHAAIGLSPDKLEFSEDTKTQTLFLRNLGDKTEQIQIRPEDEKYAEYVTIIPARSFLRPDESLAVQISMVNRENFSTKLEVAALGEQSGALSIGSGVKIPLTMNVGRSWVFQITPLLLALVVTITIYLIRKKRT